MNSNTRITNFIKMKKIAPLLAVLLFTISAVAQETKPVAKEKAKKESCCAKKDSKSKEMSATAVEKCKKASGKKCGT